MIPVAAAAGTALLEQGLSIIASNPKMLDDVMNELSLPNIPMPVMDAGIFWTDIAESNGWRVQRNSISQHCRILDPDNIRRAWGGMNRMEELMKKMASVGR